MSKEKKALSGRERQIMDVLYRKERASAAEIHAAMEDAPSYTAVRTLLGILQEKGHLRFRREGPRYIYEPTEPKTEVAKTALQKVVDTFFGGSVERVVATLIDSEEAKLSDDDYQRLLGLVEEARKAGQ
jgi:predicted transcriptional regulator